MYAQRKAPYAPRTNPGRFNGYRQAPIRARVGLAMRRAMNFGPMPDAEAVLRQQGLSLAPMSVGDAGMNYGGTSILATATAEDIDSGVLRALVVPAGAADEQGQAALSDVITRARSRGAPILAFGEGVAATLNALGRPDNECGDAPAIMVTLQSVEALSDMDALVAAAQRVS